MSGALRRLPNLPDASGAFQSCPELSNVLRNSWALPGPLRGSRWCFSRRSGCSLGYAGRYVNKSSFRV
eukprot:11204607-Alexandrium_andersonii.AAC.1